MHTLLAILFLIPYCLLGLIPVPVLAVIGLFRPEAPRLYACRYIRLGCRILTFLCGADITVSGAENIPDTPVYYVLNHRSLFDIVFTYPYMKLPTGFVAKNSLARVPFLAQWMHVGYSLFLDRSDIRKGLEIMKLTIENLESGVSMAIFPEGTRNKSADPKNLMEFHSGSFRPVKKTDVPLVPVAIYYDRADCFENHLPWVRKTSVRIIFSAPVYCRELPEKDRRAIDTYTQSIIQELLNSCEQ